MLYKYYVYAYTYGPKAARHSMYADVYTALEKMNVTLPLCNPHPSGFHRLWPGWSLPTEVGAVLSGVAAIP